MWPKHAGRTLSLTQAQLDKLMLGLAHARRTFFDLLANHKSTVADEALKFFVQLYEVEREVQ
jgi:Transposase IS66 family